MTNVVCMFSNTTLTYKCCLETELDAYRYKNEVHLHMSHVRCI